VALQTVIGLDLGQVSDYTALAVVRANGKDSKGRPVWAVPHLERWPLGTSYPDIVAAVSTLVRSLDQPALVIDATGVGRAVADLFREADLSVDDLVAVTIVCGHRTSRLAGGEIHVPKKDLVGAVQSVLQSRRLKIARSLPLAPTLTQELSTFRVKINVASATESFEAWRERDHDDLVLAVALAVHYAEEPSPELNVIAFNLEGRIVPPEPLRYEQVRLFHPTGKYQPMPIISEQVIPGQVDFRTQEEAAWFVRLLHQRLGSVPPNCEIPELESSKAATVEKAVGDFIRTRNLKPQSSKRLGSFPHLP